MARALDRFLRQHVIPFNYRVTLLCGDRARQYEKGPLADYCLQNNIKQRFWASNRHELNGVAERYNRTHAEGARALLVQARLPLEYWQFAMATIVHLRNRLPSGANPGYLSPWELLTLLLPDISKWRVWGCPAYVLVPNQKWPTRGRPMIFIGYPDNGPG